MDEELSGHIGRNAVVWEVWGDHGLKEDTVLTVNFHFYATNQSSANALERALKEAGIEYRTNITRTFLIFKGWAIEADITRTWTLDELQNSTKLMYRMAKDAQSTFDGLGAAIDKNT